MMKGGRKNPFFLFWTGIIFPTTNSISNTIGSDMVPLRDPQDAQYGGEVPKVLRGELSAKLARLWKQSSRVEADAFFDRIIGDYENLAPKAMACLAEDRDELLRFYDFLETHRITISNSNLIERVIREVRRRTKVMDSLDNEKEVYGIVMGIVRE